MSRGGGKDCKDTKDPKGTKDRKSLSLVPLLASPSLPSAAPLRLERRPSRACLAPRPGFLPQCGIERGAPLGSLE